MHFFADLHIHSRYSRATSTDMSIEALWKWAQLKGVSVVGTGDFTHPRWFSELNEKLIPVGNGLFQLKEVPFTDQIPELCKAEVFFMPTAEISCVYSKRGKTRKIHAIVLVPEFKSAKRINTVLTKIGNLSADGRPTLGLDAKGLLRIVLDEEPDALFIPAHAWTPHYSLFGSASGFDSIEECFEELTPYIYAIETGLSSDPPMNWRLSLLDHIALVSNSDAHSPKKIAREATIFDTKIDYRSIAEAIKTRVGLKGTVEFYPEEGKYYFDGHRRCGVCLSPEETYKNRGLCPVCGKKVTIGVLNRVEQLADRKSDYTPKGAAPYYSLIPLAEIIAGVFGAGVNTKRGQAIYYDLLQRFGNELKVLTDTPLAHISEAGYLEVANAIASMRMGRVEIMPGFDGQDGKIRLLGP